MIASDLLLAVLLVAALAWFDGIVRWVLLLAAAVPISVSLLAVRGVAVLRGAQREH